MLVSRLFKLLFCVTLLFCPIVGCGGVDTSPATGDGTEDVGESTDGMSAEEVEEFEAGEGG